MKRKYVIVNKKRFYTFIILSLLLLMVLFTFIVSTTKSHSQNEQIYNEYRVGKGDTLWKISKYYSDDNKDIRQFIYEIQKINQMETSAIYEGDIIKIPVNP